VHPLRQRLKGYSPKCVEQQFSEVRYVLATPSNGKDSLFGRYAGESHPRYLGCYSKQRRRYLVPLFLRPSTERRWRMLSSAARSRGTWVAVLGALVVGFALLVVLTSPGSHPKPAQAQTTPIVVLNVDGVNTTFRNLDELTSSIKLPRADGKAAQLEPIRIVLERNADRNLQLSQWHQEATTQLTGYRKDATLTVFDTSTGLASLRIKLTNAWPAEYHLEQQGDQVVERVTLTATSIQRVNTGQ
jgi:hypothetical protein